MRVDSKGKYYTKRVTTEPLEVTIDTVMGRVRGFLHVHPGQRLSDELNAVQQYVPVTDATVMDQSGNVIYRTEFLALNKNHVLWVIPAEAVVQED